MATAIGVGLGVFVGFVAVRGSGARRGGEAGEAFGFGGLGVEGEQAGEDVVRPVVGGKHCPSLFFDLVGSCLQLSKDQISLSKDALRDGGNKSSATVPQIWDLILRDPDVKRGTLVVSLAFGPGLTAAAMVARVV